jgi:UDP-N-acetylmuramoyl-tripeptide--D-alanyl-D-alanine ligase
LPKRNGLALFNGNNENTHLLYNLTKVKKIIYKNYLKKPSKLPEIGAYDMKVTTTGTTFTVIVNGKEFQCKTSLFGAHVIENILPAIFLADKMGLSKSDIERGVAHLIAPPQTMEKVSLKGSVLGIDDTFNASPESVFAAFDYMTLFKKKRIMVLGPLTELGPNAKQRHFEIGKKAAESCDFLFSLNKNFFKEILKGIKSAKSKCELRVVSPDVAAEEIANMIALGDIVLFEGKESKMVMKKLL